jgi:hypothetical protein
MLMQRFLALGRRFGLGILILFGSSCQAPPPDSRQSEVRLTGKPIRVVVEALGDPDEVAEGRYFGTKFAEGPIAAVFKYTRDQLYVYIGEKGIVLGVARGNTKNFIDR